MKFGPPQTTEPIYTPSYGRSQFIGTTFVEQLLNAPFTAAEQQQLGLTSAIRQSLTTALVRGIATSATYSAMQAAVNYAAANQAWSLLTVAQRNQFTATTGLGEREYTDMKRMKTQPPTNSNGVDLSRDAQEAFATTAIMHDRVERDYLMEIFENFDQFTIMSHALMRQHLNAALAAYPNATEEETAARVARAHNGGTWKHTLAQLTSSDTNNYVKRFLGYPNYTNEGDWRSLRCADEMIGRPNVAPGTQGQGLGGLEMRSLTLP